MSFREGGGDARAYKSCSSDEEEDGDEVYSDDDDFVAGTDEEIEVEAWTEDEVSAAAISQAADILGSYPKRLISLGLNANY